MSDTMMAVPAGSPVMKAWEIYKSQEEYANSRRWALHEDHVDGSMWAAFYAGFWACAVNAATDAANAVEEIDRLRTALATARNDALDEAARLCDEKGFRARAAIRALITKPTIEGGKPKAEKDPDT